MWDGDTSMDHHGGGGGFYDTTNKFDSPSTDKKQGGKKAQSVSPIVISMIQDQQNKDEFAMWGFPVTIIKLVCIVRKFEITATTITYELEDHTGRLKAIYWLEHDPSSEPNIPVDKENIYARVYGNLRSKGDEKVLMILKMAPMANINEIHSHLLETIFVRVMREKQSKGEASMIKANNPGAQLSNSMMSYGQVSSYQEEDGMTSMQKTIFQYMKSINGEASKLGVNKSLVYEKFTNYKRAEIDEALQFLVSEGHMFSTIDSDHFQITNAL